MLQIKINNNFFMILCFQISDAKIRDKIQKNRIRKNKISIE